MERCCHEVVPLEEVAQELELQNINGYNCYNNIMSQYECNLHGWLGRSSASSIHSKNASYSSCTVEVGKLYSTTDKISTIKGVHNNT